MTRDLQSFQFRVQAPEQDAVLFPVVADEDLFLLPPITMGERSLDGECRHWNRPLAVALGLGEHELAIDPLCRSTSMSRCSVTEFIRAFWGWKSSRLLQDTLNRGDAETQREFPLGLAWPTESECL
jgi:hypothetical protein